MPAGAVWISAKETSLVDVLLDNKLEAGDGGNFKTTTYQRAVTHITPLRKRGVVKTVNFYRPHLRKALALGNKLTRQLPLFALCLTFTAALAPPALAIAPLPVCRTNAVTAVQHLKADWLNVTEQVVLIDFLRTDRTEADIYSALTKPDVRKEWVRIQLEKCYGFLMLW
ncbi:hypothetical protein B0H34DRAFT_859325 [Crassisporium funariophilum]|nr:hypothetical protein B0H34DRAFT_859325 [Crassisporium funariophilum]